MLNNNDESLRVTFKKIDDPDSQKRLEYTIYTPTGYRFHPVASDNTGDGEYIDVYYLTKGTYVVAVENVNWRGEHYCGWMAIRIVEHEVIGEGRYEHIKLPLSSKPVWMPAPCEQCWDEAQRFIHWETAGQEEMALP